MNLRNYQHPDAPLIARLFFDTVHSVNKRDYTGKQLQAWTGPAPDPEKWDRILPRHHCLVAVEGDTLLGFADMDSGGFLHHLYVHRDHQGEGIGTALCDALERESPGPFTTHASITARPFFEKRGYHILNKQQVEKEGIIMTNFVMIKNPPVE